MATMAPMALVDNVSELLFFDVSTDAVGLADVCVTDEWLPGWEMVGMDDVAGFFSSELLVGLDDGSSALELVGFGSAELVGFGSAVLDWWGNTNVCDAPLANGGSETAASDFSASIIINKIKSTPILLLIFFVSPLNKKIFNYEWKFLLLSPPPPMDWSGALPNSCRLYIITANTCWFLTSSFQEKRLFDYYYYYYYY